MKRLLLLTITLAGFTQPLLAAAPCCSVTAVDARTGTVTARDTATGRAFEFQLSNARLLAAVRIGTPVYANFSAKQVSLDGRTACCAITKIALAPPGSGAGVGLAPPPTAATNTARPAPAMGIAPTAAASASPASASLRIPGQAGLQIPDIAGSQQPLQFTYSSRPSTVQATFINQGTDMGGNPQPQWYVDGQPSDAQSVQARIAAVNSWARGTQRTFSTQLSLAPGLHEIRAVIPGQPGETNTNNNTAIFPAFAGMPDLVAEYDEKFITEHEYRRFRFWATNKGNAPSTPFRIRMIAYSRAGSQPPDPAQQDPWNQDGTVTADIPAVPPAQRSNYLYAQLRYATVYSVSNPSGVDPGPRQYKFEFFVDEANAVPENNKQDNTLIFSETLAGAHDTKTGENHW
jgi:hypothetical protein